MEPMLIYGGFLWNSGSLGRRKDAEGGCRVRLAAARVCEGGFRGLLRGSQMAGIPGPTTYAEKTPSRENAQTNGIVLQKRLCVQKRLSQRNATLTHCLVCLPSRSLYVRTFDLDLLIWTSISSTLAVAACRLFSTREPSESSHGQHCQFEGPIWNEKYGANVSQKPVLQLAVVCSGNFRLFPAISAFVPAISAFVLAVAAFVFMCNFTSHWPIAFLE